MSYPYRNRTKLSDRLRGKSGEEIINELRNQLDADRKMFFESTPSWNSMPTPGSFCRAGNPLDETMMSRGRQDIRSHLDDLAQRHPEFADHLRCPPWAGEMGATSHSPWGQKRRGSGSSGDNCGPSSEAGAQGGHWEDIETDQSDLRGRPRQTNLPQHGLRNTVDLGQQQQQQQQQQQEEQSDGHDKTRGQRSWSAPPDNRTQTPPDPPRFVSRLDINPLNTNASSVNTDQGKPPVVPKQSQPQSNQSSHQQSSPSTKSQQGSNVRHIPIFVEGRDEPLLPKNAEPAPEKVFSERILDPPQQPSYSFSYGRPSHFTNRHFQQQGQSPPPKQQPPPPPQKQQPPPPPQSSQFATAPPKSRFQQQQPPQQQQQQQQKRQQPQPAPTEAEAQCKVPPEGPKQYKANDPIAQVHAIQKDVDDLKLKVGQFSGTSRKDKDYMYLDEMLTRNLLKLDNIETEGKDNVRQARKEVIRNIQQCISTLESKVPATEENQNVCEESEMPLAEVGLTEDTNTKTPENLQKDEFSDTQGTKVKEDAVQVEQISMDIEAQNTDKQSSTVQINVPLGTGDTQTVMEVEHPTNTDPKECVTVNTTSPPGTTGEMDKTSTGEELKEKCDNTDKAVETLQSSESTQMQVDNVEHAEKVENNQTVEKVASAGGQEVMEVDNSVPVDTKTSCEEIVKPSATNETVSEMSEMISKGETNNSEAVSADKTGDSDTLSANGTENTETVSKNETLKSCDTTKPAGKVTKAPKSPKGSPKKGKKGT